MRQLLADIRVVELSDEPSGSYCAKVFADLGADVVKAEPPGGGRLRARRPAFLHLNTNKRSVVVDPDVPASRERLQALLARADVVVESPGYGDLAAAGVDRGDLLAGRPALVVCSVSGFGSAGPYAGYRWSDLVAQIAAWTTLPQSASVRVPVKLPAMVCMAAVGHTAAVGALAGVARARASGAGAHVDVAAYEALGTIPSRAGRFLGWEYRGRQRRPIADMNATGTLIPMGIFPAADGFVSMMSTPQQLPEMLRVLGDEALAAAFARPDGFVRPETKEVLDAALYPWLLSHTRLELTAAAQAAGWPFAHVNEPHEVLEVDHLHQRGFWAHVDDVRSGRLLLAGAPYRHAEGGWGLRRTAPELGAHAAELDEELTAEAAPAVAVGDATSPDQPPLAGVRVLDLTTVWSGPYLTQLLADLGAEVIRVENPSVFPPTTKGYVPRPDLGAMNLGALLDMYGPPAAGRPDRPYNRHAMNNSIARNKLSVTLDPRQPEQRELFMRLVERSDVFVENLKTSTMHQLGLHESQLMDRNPRMIVVRIPPAGLTGDWANYTGFGAQFDGLSGLVSLTGHHDEELVEIPSTTYMDAATGPAGAFAVIAALHYRRATGRGQVIELAQMENVIAQLGDVFLEVQHGIPAQRLGNRDRHMAPQGVYRCRGEGQPFLAVSVEDDEQWEALAGVVGGAELAADERFATLARRWEHHDELDSILAAWAADQDPVDAFRRLQAAGVASGALFDDEALVADPNVAARQWLRPLTTADTGTHLHIGHAFRGLPQVWRRGSPALGADNRYVFGEVLGLDEEELARLAEARVLVEDYLDEDGNPV